MPDPTLTLFRGREIATAIVNAVEAIPAEYEIVTFSAGENMPIRCAFVTEDDDGGFIPEFAWNGEAWEMIGYL